MLSFITFFVLRSKTPLLDRLSPMILTSVLLVFVWIESIFNYYDQKSASLLFNVIGSLGLISSIFISIYWVKNVKLVYKKEKQKLLNNEI